jgi:AcrR family transcriptional regulator
MPRLWTETIEAHRREVGDAILDTTVDLVVKHGLRGVTMSQIAEAAGIGRATLYKYFKDVESILVRWHEKHVGQHLDELVRLEQSQGRAIDRLRMVLSRLAAIESGRDHGALGMLLHQGEHATRVERHLQNLVRHLIEEAGKVGDVRDDVPASELSQYCLNALAAAGRLSSRPALRRLVDVVLAGLGAPLDIGDEKTGRGG